MTRPAEQPSDAIEPVPAAAVRVFGSAVPLAERYAELLVSDGVLRGLIGPREAGRIWSRHLLNCAVVAEFIPQGARVVDVGSGAGLPGIPLALARPDIAMTLLEPLQRRVEFLAEAVEALDIAGRVTVVRGRSEEPAVRDRLGEATVVVARAVAPLDRLVKWCLPLVAPGSWLLALKGQRAQAELAAHPAAVRRAGGSEVGVVLCGSGVLDPPTAVIRVRRGAIGKRHGRGSAAV